MWQQSRGRIEANEEFMPGHFKLTCQMPEIAQLAKPGQFVHVQINSESAPFLRRPISIFQADKEKGEITLLYRAAGKGTRLLAQKRPGQLLDMLGPLGNGFTLPRTKLTSILVIGGGIGLAPLQYLTNQLTILGHNITLLAGLRDQEQLPLIKYFPQNGVNLLVTTDDGSYGTKGIVTTVSEQLLRQRQIELIYACGPEGMLAAVAEQADKHQVPCQISLERTMACGVGACLGCTCETKKEGQLHYSHVCKDGPVFWGNEVIFNG